MRELAAVSGLPVGELAEVIGEAVTAGVLVESGLDLVFRHGLIAQALEDLAVVQAAGDADAARATLREAVQIYASLGAEWDTMRADNRLRPFGVRRRREGTRRPETGWDALTPTEAKIAAMVGEGLSPAAARSTA